jgi:hypothetical protein
MRVDVWGKVSGGNEDLIDGYWKGSRLVRPPGRRPDEYLERRKEKTSST